MNHLRDHPYRLAHVDPDRLRIWLQQEVTWAEGTHLEDLRLNRLWVGHHGRLSFELALDLTCDGVFDTYMLQGGSGSFNAPRRAHAHGRVSRHGLKGLRLFSSELGLWCCTPDRDWKLPAVRALLDGRRAASVLAETAAAPILGLEHTDGRVRCEITAYRAGKRCVLRARSGGSPKSGDVFIKVLKRLPCTEHIETLQRLSSYFAHRSHGGVRIPAFIDSCTERRMLIMEAASSLTGGERLFTESMVGSAHPTTVSCGAGSVAKRLRPLGTGADDLSAAAAALAILHDAPIGVASGTHTPEHELQTVRRWVPALHNMKEEHYSRLREITMELTRLVTTMNGPGTTLVHRDFYSSQMLRAGETVWLLDFDTLCVGDREVDVSTFVAHVFLDGLMAGAPTAEVQRTGARFVEEYVRSGGRVAKSRMRLYLPCALARLGAIHLARGVPAHVVDGLWDLAADHLAASWQLV